MALQPLGRISDFDGFLASDGLQQTITWRGFESPVAEQVYRLNHFDRDRFHGTLFIVAHLLLLGIRCFYDDWQSSMYEVFAARSLQLVGGLLALVWLRRTTSPQWFDRVLGGYVVVNITSAAYLLPNSSVLTTTFLFVIFVGLMAFLLPMAWLVRAVVGLCLAAVYSFRTFRADWTTFSLVILAVVVGLSVLGTLLAYEAGRWRRQRFLTLANEVLRRTALEQTIATNKPLARIIPVCAYCYRVRNAQGKWLLVDRYLREAEGVSVSHGICVDCLAKQSPEQSDTK